MLPQAQKDSRATTSCTECQRRKQKCSREWPCNHCQARKVPHMCQFSAKKVQQESSPESARESSSDQGRSLKRSFPDPTESRSVSRTSDEEEPENGLKAWGFMPGHVHFKIGDIDDGVSRKDASAQIVTSDAVDKALHAIPPRSITDAFVNHFLTVVNYRYSAIYGPTLADNYVQWWTDRAAGKRLSPEFTCLLLRICAYSVQYLTPSMRQMIEFELACSSQALTERFAAAAEQLSQSFVASSTTIERVQEKFLKGAWLKSESRIVESWHTLGCTIREAQELGIDKDAGIEGLSEFDIEIRRRIWTLLYIWDWQMSAWLGRPNLIDQKNLTFKFPNLRLDQSTTKSNLLSPFAHITLQAQLGRRVTSLLGDAQSTSDLSAEAVLAIEAECEKFMDELPPIFRITDTDTSLDEEHPYFVFQRLQMHCVIQVTRLDFLKPYLTRERKDVVSDHDDKFRSMGVDIALRVLKVARKLFDHEFPINAKFHMVVFCIFDTATTLCSAIIHDREHVLPSREEVMDVIESSLDMLHQLSLTTKLGASSYDFLSKLVQATPELHRCCRVAKRQRQASLPTPVPVVSSSTAPSLMQPVTGPAQDQEPVHPTAGAVDHLSLVTTTDDVSSDLDQFLAQNPFGEFNGNTSTPDMGGMEQIWDWAELRLDNYSQYGPPWRG